MVKQVQEPAVMEALGIGEVELDARNHGPAMPTFSPRQVLEIEAFQKFQARKRISAARSKAKRLATTELRKEYFDRYVQLFRGACEAAGVTPPKTISPEDDD